jgi:hypothetical protein
MDLLAEQFVARLLAERLEVAVRPRVGRDHLQHLAATHVGQRLFRTQDRQRTVQAARVDFLVGDEIRRWLHQVGAEQAVGGNARF